MITFGICTSKESVLRKYNIHGIKGINFDSSSINHYKFVTLNRIRPPKGLYIGFVQEQLVYNKKFVFNGHNLKKFRTDGKHVLICLDNLEHTNIWNTDCNIKYEDIFKIIKNKIKEIQKYTDRQIIIRLKPKGYSKESKNKILKMAKRFNLKVSKSKRLVDDLINCWFGVCFNSSAVSLEFILNGIPFHCLETNIGYKITIDLKNINELNIDTYNRELFLDKVSYSLWHYGNSYYLAHYLFKRIFPVIFKNNNKIKNILRDDFKLYKEKYLDELNNRETYHKAIFG